MPKRSGSSSASSSSTTSVHAPSLVSLPVDAYDNILEIIGTSTITEIAETGKNPPNNATDPRQ
jgi:hypothetical protein